ncbi:hypothetical protein HDV62DRAFT_11969 [Trichoderma sp. SZMC 28011]
MWALLLKIETRSGVLYLICCVTGEPMTGGEDKSEEEMQLTKQCQAESVLFGVSTVEGNINIPILLPKKERERTWVQGRERSLLPAHHASQLSSLRTTAAFIPQLEYERLKFSFFFLCRGGDRLMAARTE